MNSLIKFFKLLEILLASIQKSNEHDAGYAYVHNEIKTLNQRLQGLEKSLSFQSDNQALADIKKYLKELLYIYLYKYKKDTYFPSNSLPNDAKHIVDIINDLQSEASPEQQATTLLKEMKAHVYGRVYAYEGSDSENNNALHKKLIEKIAVLTNPGNPLSSLINEALSSSTVSDKDFTYFINHFFSNNMLNNNSLNNKGRTLLHYAAASNRIHVIKLLMEKPFNVFAKTSDTQETFLHILIANKNIDDRERTELITIALEKNKGDLYQLILDTQDKNKQSLLMLGITENNSEIVKIFLQPLKDKSINLPKEELLHQLINIKTAMQHCSNQTLKDYLNTELTIILQNINVPTLQQMLINAIDKNNLLAIEILLESLNKKFTTPNQKKFLPALINIKTALQNCSDKKTKVDLDKKLKSILEEKNIADLQTILNELKTMINREKDGTQHRALLEEIWDEIKKAGIAQATKNINTLKTLTKDGIKEYDDFFHIHKTDMTKVSLKKAAIHVFFGGKTTSEKAFDELKKQNKIRR